MKLKQIPSAAVVAVSLLAVTPAAAEAQNDLSNMVRDIRECVSLVGTPLAGSNSPENVLTVVSGLDVYYVSQLKKDGLSVAANGSQYQDADGDGKIDFAAITTLNREGVVSPVASVYEAAIRAANEACYDNTFRTVE